MLIILLLHYSGNNGVNEKKTEVETNDHIQYIRGIITAKQCRRDHEIKILIVIYFCNSIFICAAAVNLTLFSFGDTVVCVENQFIENKCIFQ